MAFQQLIFPYEIEEIKNMMENGPEIKEKLFEEFKQRFEELQKLIKKSKQKKENLEIF